MKYIIILFMSVFLVSCDESSNNNSAIKNKELRIKELLSKPFKDLTTEERRVLILLLESKNKQNTTEGE